MKRFIVSIVLVLLLVATIFFSLSTQYKYSADPALEPVICEVVELTAPPKGE